MKKFIEVFSNEHFEPIRNQLLFSGLSDHEIFMFIQFSSPYYIHLREGQSITLAGKYSHMISVVFSGSMFLNTVDYDGNKTLLKSLDQNENGGTMFSMFDYYDAHVELTAKEESHALLLRPETLFIAEEKLAVIQQKILVNMIASQRLTFLELSEHMACLSQRSIRDKLLSFLQISFEKERSRTFSVPYSREELANYLAVDRASLSRTLGELKREGIIDFKKSKFTILDENYFNSIR